MQAYTAATSELRMSRICCGQCGQPTSCCACDSSSLTPCRDSIGSSSHSDDETTRETQPMVLLTTTGACGTCIKCGQLQFVCQCSIVLSSAEVTDKQGPAPEVPPPVSLSGCCAKCGQHWSQCDHSKSEDRMLTATTL
jgi:hypothetical protein